MPLGSAMLTSCCSSVIKHFYSFYGCSLLSHLFEQSYVYRLNILVDELKGLHENQSFHHYKNP